MKIKCILYIVCIAMLMPSIYANFEVPDIRAYLNNERVTGVNSDGGNIKVVQDDILEMSVKLYSNINTTSKVKLKGVINDIDSGSDLIKELSYSDMAVGDERTRTLSFYIPTDADPGSYELVITATWQYPNSTEVSMAYDDFTIVTSKNEATAEDAPVDLAGSFSNLTNKFGIMVDKIDGCFGYMNETRACKDEISTCREERGTYKSSSENCASDLSVCRTEKTSSENLKNICESEKTNMRTKNDCQIEIDEKVNTAKSESQNMFLLIGAGVVVGWYLINRKKKQSTVAGSYFEKKMF